MLDIVTKIFLVIEANRRNDRTIRINHIDRVQPSAQADFENRAIEVSVGHQDKGGQGGELEIAQGHPVEMRLDLLKCLDQFV